MNLHQLIMKLLIRFNICPDANQEDSIRKGMVDWFNGKDENGKPLDGWQKKVSDWLTKWSNKWFVMVGVGFSYVFLVRMVYEFLNPETDPDDKI